MDTGIDSGSFGEVVTQFTPYSFNIAYRILGSVEDAQDVVQETFLKLYRSWHRFDREKSLKNWICTITINNCRDFHRSRKKHQHFEMDDDRFSSDKGISSRGTENRIFALELLKPLDIKYRTVMVLFYLEKQSIKEIAAALKKPEVLIKVWLCRARKLVQQKFSESGL